VKEVVITHAVRTPIGRIGGTIKDIPDKEMARQVVVELLSRSKLNPAEIDHVIFGHVKQSADPANTARVVALMAGLPEDVPAYTVHRQCGSGLQAIMDSYQMIRCDEADVVVAGGTENMSQSAYFLRNARNGLGNGDHSIDDSLVQGGPGAIPENIYGNHPMGITAENLADKYQIPREEQDAFGLESQVRTDRAIKEGRFKEQILPVVVETAKGTVLFDTDEHPRMTTMEKLATLGPAFKKGGSVTAGNSSGRNDGAAAVLVMTADKAAELGYKPMARIISAAASGCDPTIMGIGPVECTRIALERVGLTINDLDVIELNEAFAAQSLAVLRDYMAMGIDQESLMAKVNPNGGAIAMGHPLGCTGAALTVKCLYELQRVPANRYGLITMCCAGGLGVAMIVEKC